MIKVNNKPAIANISRKNLNANRLRNIITIIAIALTAVMFTSLFTVGASMMKSIELSTMRQVGTSAHGGYKFLNQEQYNIISTHPSVKDISYNIIVAVAENEALKKVLTEIRYSEDKNAKWGFNYPETGTMPVKRMDIATTTAVLDALGVPHKLGAKVPLEFTVRGITYHEEFTLCGYWQSDPVAPANEAWLSKKYVLDVAPLYEEPINERANHDISGTISCSIWFSNSWNIEEKINKVTTDSGCKLGEINDGVNWAYSASTVDFQTVVIIVLVLLMILVSGYLIIFNIFYISVAKDTQYYGLLKTIGTTRKQLKHIVRRQAFLLSCIGIPIGLLIGYLVGVFLVPYLMSFTTVSAYTVTSANPLIFIGAALFSLFTVLMSSNKPCKIAASVSPMEALGFNEVKGSGQTQRRTTKVSIISMAVKNVFRNKKKAVVVIVSLSLSIILLNSVYSVTQSFDMDKYISNNAISDFSIAESSLRNLHQLKYIDNKNILDDLKKFDGITEVSPVYMAENAHELSAAGYKNIMQIISECEDTFRPPYSDSDVALAKNEKKIHSHVYGIDQLLFSKLEFYADTVDWNRFAPGDYVIVSTYFSDGRYPYYKTGDTVTLDFGNGNTKEYEVISLAKIPYAATCLHGHFFGSEFILPKNEYLTHYTDANLIRILLEADDDKETQIEKIISAYCEKTSLQYASKATYIEQFKGVQTMYMVVGGSLSFILALIGLLNFINSMMTSIISRRKELAMLQSIGMTGPQMKRMLIGEGLTFAVLTALFTLTIGTGIAYLLTHAIAAQIWFFSYHFTILPVIICIPIMCVIAYFIPIICYQNTCKENIVERLREAE